MGPVQKEKGDLIRRDTGKAEVLSDYFASFFTSKGSTLVTLPKLQKTKVGSGKGKSCKEQV